MTIKSTARSQVNNFTTSLPGPTQPQLHMALENEIIKAYNDFYSAVLLTISATAKPVAPKLVHSFKTKKSIHADSGLPGATARTRWGQPIG